MLQRFFAFGLRQLFGGARRGQPVLAAFGAAVSIWGLFRRLNRNDRMLYSRTLKDGESVRISQQRGAAAVSEAAAGEEEA